jgi:xanthine dehydrogenase small subunit
VADQPARTLTLEIDGHTVAVPDDGSDLLTVLRERLGKTSPKDGCSPQGQCGCCTVLVDGAPRVACVTPARRVRGRAITTLEGLDRTTRQAWADAFTACGASQCGFCTPGIIMRLEGLRSKGVPPDDTDAAEHALLAHLCRCTGWRTIVDAWTNITGPATGPAESRVVVARSPAESQAAIERATIEGRNPQQVGPKVAAGQGGFAEDTAPDGALVAVPDGSGGWSVGETLAEARAGSGKIQGRRTTSGLTYPVDVPPGDWDATLRTTWTEPAYLEPDASWCRPGEEPVSPLANGGAFGGKAASMAPRAAKELAQRYGRPVRVVLSREDAVRLGPKRPPVAGGARRDGSGLLRIVRTPGIAEAIHAVAPRIAVEEIDVPGPPTSAALRAAGWAEALALVTAAARRDGAQNGAGHGAADVEFTSPDGATAQATVVLGDDPRVRIRVRCGEPLDEIVLRSYCVGATHAALSLVCSEGLAVDDTGTVHDLTIRSFGLLRATDTPPIDIEIDPDSAPPINGSDAVFVAVTAASWLAQGAPPEWPTGSSLRA